MGEDKYLQDDTSSKYQRSNVNTLKLVGDIGKITSKDSQTSNKDYITETNKDLEESITNLDIRGRSELSKRKRNPNYLFMEQN